MGVDEAKQALTEALALVIELHVLSNAGLLKLLPQEPLFPEGALDGLVETSRTDDLRKLLGALYGGLTKLHHAVGGTMAEIDALALLVDWHIPTCGSREVH